MILYQIGIAIFGFLIKCNSFFNPKARLWIKGRKGIFEKLKNTNFDNSNLKIWFHCASLGEFEQARPIIEKIKKDNQNYRILLTFFSPSGYEIRKNYSLADWIFYLPLDTIKNANEFVKITNPTIAIFIKYEFWHNYIFTLHKNKIPVFSVCAIFRKNQYYFNFKKYFLPNPLPLFSHIFVQNEISQKLLLSTDIKSTVCGDTRFDRVSELANNVINLPKIEKFKENKKLLIIGSAWLEDIKVIFNDKNEILKDLKIIIAPHEIDTHSVSKIASILTLDYGLFTKNDFSKPILIIDSIGLLNQMYQYADVAYVGGAFGKGLHNILEAATYGVPVVFGKNYQKFQEAIDLVCLKGAVSVENEIHLNDIFNTWFLEDNKRVEAGKIAKKYVLSNIGSVEIIYDKIFKKSIN
ncbi:MAG: 3-deoxy-D-manno-octulosonic acid transferase [Cytophagales bacterium]|nr:MAG: 3-deoxy-D-manno-octulosonic acid transferase [Cytophagales bacterium]